MATETVANLANEAISQREKTGEHPLDLAAKTIAADNTGSPEAQADASCQHLLTEHRAAEKSIFGVYQDDFISILQGGPREGRIMLRHLFHQIYQLLRPNKE